MPEELVKPEELSKYRQVASHVVSGGVPANSEMEPSVLGRNGRGAGEEWSEAPGPVSAMAAEWSGLLFPASLAFPVTQ